MPTTFLFVWMIRPTVLKTRRVFSAASRFFIKHVAFFIGGFAMSSTFIIHRPSFFSLPFDPLPRTVRYASTEYLSASLIAVDVG